MLIEQLMSRPVHVCDVDDTVERAARIMWEHDCGIVPVLDDEGDLVGVITDRDICMAAYTQGEALGAIPIWTAMAADVIACHPNETIEEAERKMSELRVRRLPVVDRAGRVVGLLSLNDVVRERAKSRQEGVASDVVRTMAAICEPRHSAMAVSAPTTEVARA